MIEVWRRGVTLTRRGHGRKGGPLQQSLLRETRPIERPVSSRLRRVSWRFGLLVVVGACLAGCGTDTEGDVAPATEIGTSGTSDTATLGVGSTPDTTPPLPSEPMQSAASTSADSAHSTLELRPVFQCQAGALTSSPTPTSVPPLVAVSDQDVLPTIDGLQVCLVGPVGATQEVIEVGSAQAEFDPYGQWVVTFDLRPDGVDVLNSIALRCFEGDISCPSHQLAIVVDGVIQSAPTVQTPEFPGTMQISGNLTEDEARTLARTLNAT